MHELAIAGRVVDIANRHANGRKVTKVYLKVGYLRQVVPTALSFSFDLVAQETSVEGAELDLEEIPATGLCKACGTETSLRSFPLQCGSCAGFDLKITQGEELYVESLEMEEEKSPTQS